jgi:hypothetical protein
MGSSKWRALLAMATVVSHLVVAHAAWADELAPGVPPALPPPGQARAAATEPSTVPERSDDDRRSSVLLLTIAAIAAGVAGAAAGVGTLLVGSERGVEADELRTTIKTETAVLENQCNGPLRHGRCDELESVADERVVLNTAGFLLFAGGASLALASGMYLTIESAGEAGGGGPRDGSDQRPRGAALQIVPAVSAQGWGAILGGTF